MTPTELSDLFNNQFGESGEFLQFFFAPGRVCLIGEHIDYNGGNVLPAAISKGIYAVFRHIEGNTAKLHSTFSNTTVSVNLNQTISNNPELGWANYPLGIIDALIKVDVEIQAFELLFYSDLPVSAGLSSSAAIEVLTAFIFAKHLRNTEQNLVKLAKLCQQVENQFVGVQCGIMDQFAVALGKQNNAILLNCDTLNYQYIPTNFSNYQLLILNTNKKRKLVDSAFNTRTGECNNALKVIQQHQPINNLAEATIEQVEKYITEPIIKKRALHVVSENQRVLQSAEALKAGDVNLFGQLLYQSHLSLKNNYEVTGTELDAIVEAAIATDGCIGAKMSGAGFGGCALALVKANMVEVFSQQVKLKYNFQTSINADIFPVSIVDGVHQLYN